MTYMFSELTSINSFALWNDEFAGLGKTQLQYSVDGKTYATLMTITPKASEFAPAGRSFPIWRKCSRSALTEMLFFRLVIADCPGPPRRKSTYRGCGIGEVAFSAEERSRPIPGRPDHSYRSSACSLAVIWHSTGPFCLDGPAAEAFQLTPARQNEKSFRPCLVQIGIWLDELPCPQELHRIHQRLGCGFHIRLNASILVKIGMAFGIGAEVADVSADVGLVARLKSCRCPRANRSECA